MKKETIEKIQEISSFIFLGGVIIGLASYYDLLHGTSYYDLELYILLASVVASTVSFFVLGCCFLSLLSKESEESPWGRHFPPFY